MKIGLVQMRCGGSREDNLRHAEEMIADGAQRGASIVCLPELFLGPYFCQSEDIMNFDRAETIPGPATQRLGEVARRHNVGIVAPLFERRAEGVFHNSAAYIDAAGRIAIHYRKMHIPDDPLFHEKFYFTPGDRGIPVAGAAPTISVLICWDQWFPEAARIATLKGAHLLFYPTAIGWMAEEKADFGEEQADAWETIQRGHAIANGVYVAAVNRVGIEGGLEFWGRSFVADPMGKVVARAGGDEEILLADVDLARLEYVRRTWPFLRDRRIDAYAGITERMLLP